MFTNSDPLIHNIILYCIHSSAPAQNAQKHTHPQILCCFAGEDGSIFIFGLTRGVGEEEKSEEEKSLNKKQASAVGRYLLFPIPLFLLTTYITLLLCSCVRSLFSLPTHYPLPLLFSSKSLSHIPPSLFPCVLPSLFVSFSYLRSPPFIPPSRSPHSILTSFELPQILAFLRYRVRSRETQYRAIRSYRRNTERCQIQLSGPVYLSATLQS
jgi:hypothetical protein